MSGQAQQSFPSTPGPRSDIGSTARGPSIGTQQFQPTPARFTNDGRGLAMLGDALGSFFGGVAKVESSLDEINHREELVQIQRENEALAQQGVADQQTGKPMDPVHAQRNAYRDAFVTSYADREAFQLGQELETEMEKRRGDDSLDPIAFSRQFFKDHIGNGSGDPALDSRLLAGYTRYADAQVARFNDQRAEKAQQNNLKEVNGAILRQVFDGMTAGKMADLRKRAGDISKGNNVTRDKILLGALSEGIQNSTHATAVLESMQELGLDESEPEFFASMTEAAMKRTNSVKTFDAAQEVEGLRIDVAKAKSQSPQGQLSMEAFLPLWHRAHTINLRHGTGMQVFGLLSEWPNVVKAAAEQNALELAITGIQGTHSLGTIARSLGKDWKTVIKDHGAAVLTKWAGERSAAIRATINGTGLAQPMDSDAAMRDLGTLVVAGGPNGRFHQAFMGTLPEEVRHEIGAALMGRDPQRGERAFAFVRTLKAAGFTPEQIRGYLPSDAAEERFNTLDIYSSGSLPVGKLLQFLADNPYDAAAFNKAASTGRPGLYGMAQSMGYAGTSAEFDKKLKGHLDDAILSATGRDTLAEKAKRYMPFLKGSVISMGTNEEAQFTNRVLQQLVAQKAIGMPLDLDLAAKTAAKQSHGYILVPGYDGAFRPSPDPFNGRGRHMEFPINMDPSHPLSTSKNYPPIYSPGVQIVNALGKVEDTAETWLEDAEAAHDNFPGIIPEHSKLYLEHPNKPGLAAVRSIAGIPQFVPGHTVALRVGPTSVFDATAGLQKVVVPKDPKEAAEFFRTHLPPGFYVQQDGADTPNGRAWTLYYGARLKVGKKEMDAMMVEGQRRMLQFRQDVQGVTQTTVFGEGAASTHRHVTGSVHGSQLPRRDPGDTGPSWGALGGALSGPAAAAAGGTADAAIDPLSIFKE